MSLFSGSLADRRSRYSDFRALMRQAQTYWDAASTTKGSAAALPFYYSQLQLAKAELLITNASEIQAGSIMHGLRKVRSRTRSIRSDYLEVTRGVFPLLFEKRTGRALPIGTRISAVNLLSLIPEIGLEMSVMSPTRPETMSGYYAVAMDDHQAWSVMMMPSGFTSDSREPIVRRLNAGYEEVEQKNFANWRGVFAVSSRMYGGNVRTFQSRKTMWDTGSDGLQQPNLDKAIPMLSNLMGDHLRLSAREQTDFTLTASIQKSKSLVIPLDLVRYAVIFYLSSLVRYHPAAVDPTSEPAQAYLMDSLINDVPLGLLVGALDGISGIHSFFEPGDLRV